MKRAWHSGDSWWGGPIDMNSASIGIELDNDGKEVYPEPQIAALLNLLADLKKRYAIPGINILGHGDIAPGRKVDPDINFPWRRLPQQGLGLWCEPPFDPAPPSPNAGTLLGAFGYDISNADAAIAAFNRHFTGVESSRMTDEARARLYCLVLKKWAGEAAERASRSVIARGRAVWPVFRVLAVASTEFALLPRVPKRNNSLT